MGAHTSAWKGRRIVSRSSRDGSAFANRLREEREHLELSQAQLADQAGLQPSAISHFETGARTPALRSLRRLAQALGVTSDFLLGRVDKRDQHAEGPPDALYRDIQRLSADDREFAKQFIQRLGKAAEQRRRGGEKPSGEGTEG